MQLTYKKQNAPFWNYRQKHNAFCPELMWTQKKLISKQCKYFFSSQHSCFPFPFSILLHRIKGRFLLPSLAVKINAAWYPSACHFVCTLHFANTCSCAQGLGRIFIELNQTGMFTNIPKMPWNYIIRQRIMNRLSVLAGWCVCVEDGVLFTSVAVSVEGSCGPPGRVSEAQNGRRPGAVDRLLLHWCYVGCTPDSWKTWAPHPLYTPL